MKNFLYLCLMSFALMGCLQSEENTTNTDNPEADQTETDQTETDQTETDQTDNDPADNQAHLTAFPVGLIVASPTDSEVISTTPTTRLTSRVRSTATRSTPPYYAFATQRLNAILTGTTPLSSVFSPNLLYRNVTDASCFGPQLAYQNHPDGADGAGSPPTLPTGDLGLWSEVEGATTEACAAAQLNAQMVGIRDRSMASLMVVASTVNALYASGKTLPSAGVTENITSQMNGLSVSGVTFNTVTLEHTPGNQFVYDIDFSYTRGTDTFSNKVQLTHEPDGTTVPSYRGLMTYQIEDDFQGGNCDPSGFTRHDITRMGSLAYEKTSADDFVIESREAQFCGHGVIGGYTADNQLDPSEKYDATSNPDGWGNNFSWFKADYDKTDLSGHYAYTWQAGPFDSHSRVFNVGLNPSRVNSTDGSIVADGESWYGYGTQVDDTSGTLGEINGFICNWAGPNGSHAEQEYAQRQFLRHNATTGVYEAPTGGSNLVYAPTNSCTYSGGSFQYDRNLNGSFDSGDIVEVVTTTPTTSQLAFDLFPQPSNPTYGGMLIEAVIAARGYRLPNSPTLP